MAPHLFGYCPFGGIICLPCNEAIPAEGKGKVEWTMAKHLAKQCHKENCADQELTAVELRLFVAFAKSKLLAVAVAFMKHDSAAGKRQVLARFLKKRTQFFYCGDCNKYFVTQRGDRNSTHRAGMATKWGHCPVGLIGSSRVIPADFDPLNFAIYCKLFRELLDEARALTRVGWRDRASCEAVNGYECAKQLRH
jgi:hypothetical protein